MELCSSTLEKCVASEIHKQEFQKCMNDLLKQIALGIEFLHHRAKIVHRDIKPSNILVVFPSQSTNNKYILKLADFGISKKLDIGENDVTVERRGSNGWKAPEIGSNLAESETEYTNAVDVFAGGCVFYFTFTLGNHPFGSRSAAAVDYKACQSNIDNDQQPDLELIGFQPTLRHLVAWMISHSPQERPTFRRVLSHPFFWTAKETLDFICDLSKELEYKGKPTPEQAHIIQRLESSKDIIFDDDWKQRLSAVVLKYLEETRKYNGKSVHNLLRAIRNKVFNYTIFLKKIVIF